jgi:hypothetical protein
MRAILNSLGSKGRARLCVLPCACFIAEIRNEHTYIRQRAGRAFFLSTAKRLQIAYIAYAGGEFSHFQLHELLYGNIEMEKETPWYAHVRDASITSSVHIAL